MSLQQTEGTSSVPVSEMDPVGDVEGNADVKAGASIYGTRYARSFKLKVLKDADECLHPGEIGRVLRRYGITHATLTSFRRQRASGSLAAAPSSKATSASATAAASPVAVDRSQARRVLDLERENRALKRRLTQAEAIIEVQKNVSRLLEMSLGDPERRGND